MWLITHSSGRKMLVASSDEMHEYLDNVRETVTLQYIQIWKGRMQ